jgi:hypothetical protein
MNKILIAIIALIVIGGGYYVYSVEFSSSYDGFADCLRESGALMYGAYWCPHCAEQKAMFKGSKDKIPYVECSLPNRAGQTQVCKDAGITSYPTWDFKDVGAIRGKLTLDELSQVSGCPITS